jgi:hypothetical protein
METPAITWRPPKIAADEALVVAMLYYVGERRSNFRLYANGTVLLIKADGDSVENAHRCLRELLFIPDFRVVEMRDGNFMVSIHEICAVLLLRSEIEEQMAALRMNDEGAKFSGEAFLQADKNLPIGLIGRAKLWRDSAEKSEIHHHVAAEV